jgi:hypothetical protein
MDKKNNSIMFHAPLRADHPAKHLFANSQNRGANTQGCNAFFSPRMPYMLYKSIPPRARVKHDANRNLLPATALPAILSNPDIISPALSQPHLRPR